MRAVTTLWLTYHTASCPLQARACCHFEPLCLPLSDWAQALLSAWNVVSCPSPQKPVLFHEPPLTHRPNGTYFAHFPGSFWASSSADTVTPLGAHSSLLTPAPETVTFLFL